MARSEARISVEIWSPESDFKDLTTGAQWMYFFLLSQPDLAHDGILALRVRRWSKQAAGVTPDEILKNLNELEQARYVVVDHDAEELLIRSFIRRDKVYRQPNVLRAAQDHLPLVTSDFIRSALFVELRRVQKLEMPDGSVAIIAEMLEAIGEPFPEDIEMPTRNPSENPSDIPTPGTPGERGMVTAVSKDSPYPVPRSEDTPASASPTLDRDDNAIPSTQPNRRWAEADIDADPHFKAFWSAYPRKTDKGHARKAWLKALRERKASPEAITDGARTYAADPHRAPSFTAHAATWLNGERWADQRETMNRRPQPWEA